MKREEKNMLTRQRIMESALKEFSENGYGASSINNICSAKEISKGIIYHYFRTKDEVYLACVEECFRALTDYLRNNICLENKTAEEQLKLYFSARMEFFYSNPVYQRIFCDAVLMPAAHLKKDIEKLKKEFDDLNVEILKHLISPLKLRQDVSQKDVIDTFRQFQDYINARYQMAGIREIELKAHEESCCQALNILLYGVVEREQEEI